MPGPATPPLPTPSQTVGPFYGYALPFPGGGEIAPVGHPDTITLHGYVYDGAGQPVPDALIETWQPGPDCSRTGAPGSLRHDPVTGRVIGRDGVAFTGFGRVPTDADGHWAVRTLPPGGVSYISLAVFARGLLHHLYTRAYLVEEPGDALLSSLDADRRATLIARSEAPRTYRFDVRLQGADETVFLEFP
ncbi:protocatechuate 3,4-dioxygenase subunit alpha [Streptomyces sp. G44]|uniref:protocatechuate 3,4-dioxygenase subunit alpha n=1 Tax=Streptomyces sp. G44 TaxID=2807632 RepID=UPI00195F51E9|nr:protocatechuate 3,4-dioxygenase subunit alpha [Streptomyces sp. G44]MBM7173346.1 protocatechuate 3,4-dioxygenase subunit alpha [Streptomyces sp. G44]